MRGRTIILSLVMCLVLSMLSGWSLAQVRGPRSAADMQRWMKQQQLENEQRLKANETAMAQYQDEAYQEALGATADQWRKIKPRLEKVRQLAPTPVIGISIYGGGAGGGSQGGGAASGMNSGGMYGGSGGSAGAAGYSRGSFSMRDPNSGRIVTRSFSSGGPVDGNMSGGWTQFSDGGAGGGLTEGQAPVRKQVGNMSMGWQWQKIPVKGSSAGVREGEKACDALLEAVKAANPDPVQTRQRVEALRQARQQLQEELRHARDELRQVVTPAQEARLILMGYLD